MCRNERGFEQWFISPETGLQKNNKLFHESQVYWDNSKDEKGISGTLNLIEKSYNYT